MISVSVRKSTPADIDVLADFQQRLAKESENFSLDLNTVKKGILAMFDDPCRGTYFIAEVDGVIAGCHSITYEWSDWRNGMVWWLQSVYVVEKFRKAGVFRAMFEHLQSIIKNDLQVVGLRLYVDKSNSAAQKVYASIGMNGDHYAVFELMK
jgi:ribosomal protein S18 acetylase RimI-like enzyme